MLLFGGMAITDVLAQTNTEFDVIMKGLSQNPLKSVTEFEHYQNGKVLDSDLLEQYQMLVNSLSDSNQRALVDRLYNDLYLKTPEEEVVELYLQLLRAHIGTLYRRNQYDSTLLYLKKLHELAVEGKFKRIEISSWLTRGAVAWSRGDADESFEDYFKALDLAIAEKDTAYIFSIYSNISINYKDLGDFSSARKYGNRALLLQSTAINPIRYSQFYVNHGLLFNDLDIQDSALWCHQQALRYAEKSDDKYGKLLSYLNISMTHRKMGNPGIALHKLDSIEWYTYESGYAQIIALFEFNRALNSAALNKYNQAIGYGEKALELAEEIGSLNDIQSITENLSNWYEQLENWKKSLEYLKQYETISDSIRKASHERKIGEFKSREDLIISNNEKKLLESTLVYESRIRKILIVLVVALLLFVLLVGVFYYRTRLLNKLVNHQKNELQKLNDLKSEFFANISHELRTPLTLAQGNIAMLGDDVKVPSQVKRVSNARRSLSQLSRMVEDLLDLSKFELGRFRLQLQSVNMATFLNRVVSSFASLAEERQVTLQFINESSTEPFSEIDLRQFEKVINNILYNAFKFTKPHDTILITLSLKDDCALICISDTGRGISSKDLPNVFDRFYQASNHEHQVGSGLGLAIVKEIVDLHEAEISVESEEGVGTQFTIRINVTATVPVESDVAVLDLEDIIEDRLANLKTTEPTILLVEDNIEMQDFLTEILGKYFKIEKANNGMEALDKLKQIKPSLIISDVMMPVMDGFTFLEKLKKKGLASSIPFILLTARAAGEDRLKGLRLGVDDYITKPFDREELLIRVINLFENLQNRLKWAAENEDDQILLQGTIDDDDSELIENLKEFIETNVSNAKLSIPELANVVAMSDRQLYRKTAEICGMTPNQLIMEVRLQTARKLLLSGEIVKLSQLAMEVGIGTPAYLSKMFYQRFGKRPTDYIS